MGWGWRVARFVGNGWEIFTCSQLRRSRSKMPELWYRKESGSARAVCGWAAVAERVCEMERATTPERVYVLYVPTTGECA